MNLSYDAIARYYDLSHQSLVEDIPFLLRVAAETGGPALELGCLGVCEASASAFVDAALLGGVDSCPLALLGAAGFEVGERVECGIYASRPGPCREFAPFAALGRGDAACTDARRRHGMPPLAPDRG